MAKTLLERFGIETPEDIESYNLIGMDYGDGMAAAFKAGWDAVNECIKLEKLYFASGAVKQQTQNAVYLNHINSDNDAFIFDYKEKTDEVGTTYYNFKRCPGTQGVDDRFLKDDGTLAPLTYAQIMGRAFNVMVNQLFKINSAELDHAKPTIILVGRPSSPTWAMHEQAYAELLLKSLTIANYHQPVYVAVQSESTAALARQTDTTWHSSAVSRTDYVVVLDCGSSTFDVTIITPNGIPEGGEDSRQFGGNLLDNNLRKTFLDLMQKKFPGSRMDTPHGVKLSLRQKKEDFFGADGRSEDAQIYTADVRLPDASVKKLQFIIDENTMHTALSSMPVSYVENTDDGFDFASVAKADSWLDGCRRVFGAFYEKMKPFFPEDRPYPDKVILTGGVSIMPQVQQIAKECFRVEPSISDRPNFAVAEGLAYVLGTEVVKHQYLNKLMGEIRTMLHDGGTYGIRKNIALVGADQNYECTKQAFVDWYNSTEQESLYSLLHTHWDRVFDAAMRYSLGDTTRKGVRQWYDDQGFTEKIQQKLQGHFASMFPDYKNAFNYHWDAEQSIQALNGVEVTITASTKSMLGWWMSKTTDHHAALSSPERQKIFTRFKEREHEIKFGSSGLFSSQPGYYDMYMDDLSDSTAEKIINELLEHHKHQLHDYVESITPYFTMTAKQ